MPRRERRRPHGAARRARARPDPPAVDVVPQRADRPRAVLHRARPRGGRRPRPPLRPAGRPAHRRPRQRPGLLHPCLPRRAAPTASRSTTRPTSSSWPARRPRATIARRRRRPALRGRQSSTACSPRTCSSTRRTRRGSSREIERVLKPGGWAYVSWTNWYSPWGGHDMSPYHFLGPRAGPRASTSAGTASRARTPTARASVAVHIGPTLRLVRRSRASRSSASSRATGRSCASSSHPRPARGRRRGTA